MNQNSNPQNIQSVLVAVDFSRYSKTVLGMAREFSETLRLPLVVLHVVQEVNFTQKRFASARRQLSKELRDEIRVKYQLTHDIEVVIQYGRADEKIVQLAKKFDRPLIVVGHRGHNPLVRFFIGSTAERLALTCPFPLFICRGSRIVLPKKWLVPCDLSERTDYLLSELKPLQKILDAKVELFHVLEEPFPVLDYEAWSQVAKEMKTEDDKKLKSFKQRHPSLVVNRSLGHIVECIQARAKNFDAIVLTSHGVSQAKPRLGSHSRLLLRSGEKPLLLLP